MGIKTVTPEGRDLQRQVYEAARQEGFDFVGRSEWTELRTQLATSTKYPEGVDIGQVGELNVPIGADGRLVNRAADRAPGDAPSTHLLVIDVRPFVEFDGDGDAHIRWISSARVIELTKNRVVETADSTDEEGAKAARAGRKHHEYMNDPAYRDATLGFHQDNPGDAIRETLRRLGSDGVIRLPEPPRATGAPTSGRSGPPKALLAALGTIAAVVIGFFLFSGGGDSDGDEEESEAPVATSATAPSTTIAATSTTAATTTTAAPTTTSTTSTTTTTLPLVALDILDRRCFDVRTGEPLVTCVFPEIVFVAPAAPPAVVVELPADAPDDLIVILSLLYGDGPGDDVLVECGSDGVCNAFLAPSYFTVSLPEPVFVPERSDSTIEITLPDHVIVPGGLAATLPPRVASDGTENPGGDYSVVEASVILEVGEARSFALVIDNPPGP